MTNYSYQIGGSLQTNAPCYVTRKADFQLYNALKKGEFCYVLNSRQMGKSSLLVQTRHRLQQEGFKCTTIDMTRIGSENLTPLQWYKGIVTELWRGFHLLGKFNLKTWWRNEEEISLLQRLSNFIEDVLLVQFSEENLVIFIDEIDSILSLDFSTDDLFALIRFCYNQRAINPAYNRIAFAIFGVATPTELIADKKRTPFNIGTAIELEGFKLEEALPLAKGLSEKIENSEAVLKEILTWTGGQPFLTQKLCHLTLNLVLITQKKEGFAIPLGTEKSWVESAVKARIIHKWEAQDEPEHLKTIRDRIESHPERAGRLLGIYQQVLQGMEVKADDSREQIELILSGLAVKDGGKLKVKNRIYREVFNLEWVGEQLDSLRPYSQTFDAWIASQQKDESRLLRGQALKDAQTWAMGKSLSDLDYQFLAASVEFDRKEVQNALEAERTKEIEARLNQEQKTARFQRLFLGAVSTAFVIASGLGITAFWQYRLAIISQRNESLAKIHSIVRYSEALFALDRQLEALIQALKARQHLKQQKIKAPKLETTVELTLRRAIYGAMESNRFLANAAGVNGLDISQDDRKILTGGGTEIKLYATNGTLLKKWSAHQGPILAVATSPDGKIFASSSGDATVKLWNENGELLQVLSDRPAPVYDVEFSPDGEIIATAGMDRTIGLWRKDGTLLKTLTGHRGAIRQVAFSPDGETLASVSEDGTIKLWHTDGIGSLRTTLTRGEEKLLSVEFSPDGEVLAVGREDGKILLWQLPEGKLIKAIRAQTAGVWSLAFCPDGKILASGADDRTIAFWSREGTLLSTIQAHQGSIRGLVFSAGGKILASTALDGQVKLWRLEHPLLTRLFGHTAGVKGIAYSPDGSLIASVSSNETILWRPDGTLYKKIPGDNSAFAGVAFSPTENIFAASAADGVELRGTDGTLLDTFRGHLTEIRKLAFSPDGKTIASASSDRTVKLWSLSGEELATFRGHQAGVWGVAFSPDGSQIASSGGDSTIRLWQRDGRLWKTLPTGGGIAYSVVATADGFWIGVNNDTKTLKIWNREGELLSSIETNSKEIWPIALSPDGAIVAIGDDGGSIQLWQSNGELLVTLLGHSSGVRGLAFSPDSKTLASTGEDRTVILWNLDKAISFDSVLACGCDWVRDYLHHNTEVEEGDRSLCDRIGNLNRAKI